jgi:hypothetical protein
LTKYLFALLAVATVSPAAVIFSNGTPNLNNPNSRGITIHRSADDFTLGTASNVDSIRFWMVAEPGDFGGTLTYAIYQNSAGALETVIDTASVTGVTPVFLNQIPQNIHAIYEVNFALPSSLALGAGTYWLELHEGPTLTTGNDVNVLWAITSGVTGNAKQNQNPTLPTTNVGNALAFELVGAPSTTGVPEPGSIALTCVGLAAICARRYKNRV